MQDRSCRIDHGREDHSREDCRAVGVGSRSAGCRGRGFIFFQPPIASKTQRIAAGLTLILQGHRYSIKDTLFKELKPAPVVCIIAEAS